MMLEADRGITTEQVQKFSDDSIPETNTYAIDWQNGRISGKIDEMDAVQQYIYKTLKTEMNVYMIYDAAQGSELTALIRQRRTSRDYLRAEIPRLVKKALTDKRILDVMDFNIVFPDDERDAVRIDFTVETIYGTKEVEVDV